MSRITPEQLRLARGMAQLERVLRRIVRDIREAEDDTPLVKLGPGGDFTKEVYGKDGALLSPPQDGARTPAPSLFLRSEP